MAAIKELVRYNRDKVHEVEDRILSICERPVCFERGLPRMKWAVQALII